MNDLIFELADVGFSTRGHEILRGVSLRLKPGKMYGLIGSNGSGKSTLMKLLARQTRTSVGALSFRGRPIAAWSDRDFARHVAYMPQFTPPSDGMNVRELVALGRYPWHGALGPFTETDRAHVDRALERASLDGFADRPVDTLSGGERQKVWLAMMLAQDADCMLLDEPTSALDIAHEAAVLRLVREASRDRGATVVVVLHDVNLAARMCDEIIALREGRVVAHGPVADVVTPDVLGSIFGLPMGVMRHPTRDEPIGYIL